MTRYFLDTTAHVECWAGEQTSKDELHELLQSRAHATSTHALREWKRIVEGVAADVLNAIKRQPASLSDVFARLSQGWGREANQRLRVLSMIAGGSNTLSLVDLEIRADALIRFESDTLFRWYVDDVRDASECGLARNEVRADTAGRFALVNPVTDREECRKSDDICRQADDLGTKVDGLNAAAAALQASTDEGHRKMGNAAERAARNAAQRKGQVCYQKLGDVSIALECLPGEVILTTDRAFDHIGPALGLDVLRLEPTVRP